MTLPTIFVLGLLVSGISVTNCRFASHANEVHDIPNENETVANENFVPSGSITEMSYRGTVIIKKFTCPAIYGRYPHPESCEYYFECRFGWPTLWHCNRGYLYDREREQCRDRRRVKCHIGHERDHNHHRDGKDKGGKDKDGKDKEIDVKEDVGHFKCPYIWGTFAHPYDCSKYYICLYNHPKLFQCYQNFLYDTHYRKCLPSHKVKCGNRLDRDQMRTSRRPATLTTTVKPVEKSTVTPKNNKFHCPFPYGRYPDPEDCTRYYECRFSIPHLYTCPESTLYDERKEQCLEKKRVKCGGRPGGNDEDVVPVDDKNINFRCPYVWGTFAHPVDCSKYIICIYNVPSVFNCRKNELFDAHYRRCFPKEKVSCGDRINPDDPYPFGKTTSVFSTLRPTTMRKPPEPTTSQKPIAVTTSTSISTTASTTPSTTTTTTSVPTTSTTTTSAPTTTTTTTPVPTTTTTTTSVPTTTTTTTSVPTTTTTTTPVPTTTTTTTSVPTTTTTRSTTTNIPTTTTTTPAPTTTTMTTTTTPAPTTEATSPTTVSSEATTSKTFPPILPITKPNTPPPTECDEDDLDCIIDETGDITGWFDCPKRYGHFPHGSSTQLFIHCDNWRPFVKKCAEHTRFSPQYLVCVWENKKQSIL